MDAKVHELAPARVEFGKTYPAPELLRTGDILFVRNQQPRSHLRLLAHRESFLDRSYEGMKVADFLGPRRMRELALLTDNQLVFERARRLDAWAAPLAVEGLLPTGVDERAKKELAFLLALLIVEFPDLLSYWFDLTVLQFLKTPLVELLKRAFDGSIKDGFFVGHCGMVVRENDGAESADGEVYVFEANATSFAHYGVNVAPYFIADDGQGGVLRSWAQTRAARGDSAWAARPVALRDAAPQASAKARAALMRHAKAYLGRGYSFFDAPALGDAGRLYCSEFIYRVFEDLRSEGIAVRPMDDGGVRTWQWMKDNNPPGADPQDIGHWIRKVWDDERVGPTVRKPGAMFFILTVQMLWRTSALDNGLFKPDGQVYQ